MGAYDYSFTLQNSHTVINSESLEVENLLTHSAPRRLEPITQLRLPPWLPQTRIPCFKHHGHR